MRDERSIDKIDREVKKQIRPLYDDWCERANLTDLEKRILFLKEFDERKLNEWEQLEELKRDFNYYVELRTYQYYWEKIKKKKLYKILP